MPEHHARISPSSFKRTRLCPASLNFGAKFPNTSSAAAEEGTACHEAVEFILDGQDIQAGYIAENGYKLTQAHIDHIHEVTDWVTEQDFDTIFTEVRLPIGLALGLNDPDLCWGTSDIIGLKGDTAYVVDAKFGFSPVEAKGNDQGMLYLIGALHYLQPRKFNQATIVIIQPRAGGIKQSIVDMDEVDAYKETARQAIMLAQSSDAPFNPSVDACHFCPASGACRAQIDYSLKLDFDDPDILPDDEIGQLLDRSDVLKAALKNVEKQALNRLAAGKQIPGYKRVKSMTRAKYSDPQEVIEFCAEKGFDLDQVAPRSPIGITDLKKILTKEEVEALTTKPEGQPTLAKESDRRPALDSEFESF